MSRKRIYGHATRLQGIILEAGLSKAPRVALDGWASLYAWHQAEEPWWRISEEHAERMLDEPLPPDLELATAPHRGPAMAYQLPDRGEWIVLAVHRRAAPIIVRDDVYWGYAQPVLTYCTELASGDLATGYISLVDHPRAQDLQLRPGFRLTGAALTDVEILEEDYRLALAIAQHYRP